jgi:hypothetical protein
VVGVYEKTVDRESAYEKIKGRVLASPAAPVPDGAVPPPGRSIGDQFRDVLGGAAGASGPARRTDSLVESMMKSAVRAIGSQVGREIIRGVLGSLLKNGKR